MQNSLLFKTGGGLPGHGLPPSEPISRVTVWFSLGFCFSVKTVHFCKNATHLSPESAPKEGVPCTELNVGLPLASAGWPSLVGLRGFEPTPVSLQELRRADQEGPRRRAFFLRSGSLRTLALPLPLRPVPLVSLPLGDPVLCHHLLPLVCFDDFCSVASRALVWRP